jgi:uncharacterized protein YbaA (DUF1428 family)
MSYIDGFVTPVPQANKQVYLDHVREVLTFFKDHGAVRMVENWADDVPEGKVTDFNRSVGKKDDEAVLFSWIEWPSKEARNSGMKTMMQDERMKSMAMPFDGKRLIFGGFSPIVETESATGTGYADGFVVPVPAANREAYIALARKASGVFKEYGALRVVEAWGDDVPDGKVTDFRRAVAAKDDEVVVFSWIEWPSKQARTEAWPKLMADPRLKPETGAMPFDGKRMIYGGFATLLDA